MKKTQLIPFAFIAFIVFCSHDMFLKFDSFYLQSNSQAVLQLFNGTFNKSDNTIARNRMIDVSLVGNGKRNAVAQSSWFEKDSITFLNFKTGNEGTWVAGVSTAARNIELDAEAFNKYLKNDGVFDILENRKKTNTLNKDAVEKYAKHVKTIFQVGDKRTNDWRMDLGYPLEFIPLQNPYDSHPGHNLDIKLVYNEEPLKNHFVYVGTDANTAKEETTHSHDGEEAHAHSHDGEEAHSHNHDDEKASKHKHPKTQQYKTDNEGVVRIKIDKQGIWYVRAIKMIASTDPKLTHESNWATLTFGIGAGHGETHSHEENNHSHNQDNHSHDHEHGEDTHTHDDHDHNDDGFPSYVFLIASIVVVGILFFWFNRKK